MAGRLPKPPDPILAGTAKPSTIPNSKPQAISPPLSEVEKTKTTTKSLSLVQNQSIGTTTLIGTHKIHLHPATTGYASPSSVVGMKLSDFVSRTKRTSSLIEGIPKVIFQKSDKAKLIAGMNHILIAKFSHGRPSVADMKVFLANRKLRGRFHISIFDAKHVFFEFEIFEDFAHLWIKQKMSILGLPVRFFKWDESFDPSKESAISPLWIHLPGLPLFLFEEGALSLIANALGRPLYIDGNNLNRSKVSYASICIEYDIQKAPVNEVWIQFGEDPCEGIPVGRFEGFLQKVIYDYIPVFCSSCSHLGHKSLACKRGNVLNGGKHNKEVGLHKSVLIKEAVVQDAGNGSTLSEPLVVDMSCVPIETVHNRIKSVLKEQGIKEPGFIGEGQILDQDKNGLLPQAVPYTTSVHGVPPKFAGAGHESSAGPSSIEDKHLHSLEEGEIIEDTMEATFSYLQGAHTLLARASGVAPLIAEAVTADSEECRNGLSAVGRQDKGMNQLEQMLARKELNRGINGTGNGSPAPTDMENYCTLQQILEQAADKGDCAECAEDEIGMELGKTWGAVATKQSWAELVEEEESAGQQTPASTSPGELTAAADFALGVSAGSPEQPKDGVQAAELMQVERENRGVQLPPTTTDSDCTGATKYGPNLQQKSEGTGDSSKKQEDQESEIATGLSHYASRAIKLGVEKEGEALVGHGEGTLGGAGNLAVSVSKELQQGNPHDYLRPSKQQVEELTERMNRLRGKEPERSSSLKVIAARSISPVGRSSEKMTKLRKRIENLKYEQGRAIVLEEETYKALEEYQQQLVSYHREKRQASSPKDSTPTADASHVIEQDRTTRKGRNRNREK